MDEARPERSDETSTDALDEDVTDDAAERAQLEHAELEQAELEQAERAERERAARERLARAEGLYDAGDYDGAYAEFAQIYADLEGHPLRPLATYNMARCREQAHRYDEAIRLFERYLDEDGSDGRYTEAVRVRLEVLGDLLGTLEVRVSAGSDVAPAWELWDGERKIGDRITQVRLPSGSHTIRIRAEGFEEAVREVTFAAHQVTVIEITLNARFVGLGAEPFYVMLSSSVVFTAATIVLGSLALQQHGELAACAERMDCVVEGYADLDATNQRVAALAASADISLGLALASAATALVLAFFTRFDDAPAEAGTVRWRGLGAEGWF
ncbi:MAG: tetratricopeptide repeat protein [Sandaracinaceae bacterium]